jgi:hypothetical protein
MPSVQRITDFGLAFEVIGESFHNRAQELLKAAIAPYEGRSLEDLKVLVVHSYVCLLEFVSHSESLLGARLI